jgi:hypothetical protein
MADYKPDLPEGMALPAGSSINVEHADYKALVGLAEREGLSQKQFSAALGFETERAMRRAPAPPAPPAPAPKPNFDKMSTAEKFAYALARNHAPRRGG